ncbi:MAG: hypothetical protein CL470_06045 [Acidimicrobiaceae bacterium]|nr:hypothetical protein [Acidimicrobiaceae bacterium]|tara:strand:- start:1084 stop:1431 length:348 start_codon:yes stop_codon:yes gene_type:complete
MEDTSPVKSIVNTQVLQETNPWITDDIRDRMSRFHKEGIKSGFERAEKRNETSYFEKTYNEGWTDCIIAHRNGYWGCLNFNNYDVWIKSKHPELAHSLFYPDKSQSEKEWRHEGC